MNTPETPRSDRPSISDTLDEVTRELSPLERFTLVLNETVDALKRHHVTPNTITKEFTHAPFGRFGDGHLSASMTNDNGYYTGSVSFIGAEDDTRSSFIATHHISDGDLWIVGNKGTITGARLAKRLHANWPQFITDNTLATRLVDMDTQPTTEQIATMLDTSLASGAESQRIESAYVYRALTVDPVGDPLTANKVKYALHETALAINVEEHDGGLRNIEVIIEQPYDINDTTIVPIRCRVVLDELDELSSISTEYIDPYTDKKMTPKVNNPDVWFEEIERRLAELLQEKLGPLGN